MEELKDFLAVVIGASPLAEQVRRRLAQRRTVHAGVAAHLRGLRKRLAVAPAALVVIFVAADQTTIRRHGRSLRKLLDDRRGFRPGIVSIGLLENRSLNVVAAALGCDVYVGSAAAAMRSMATFKRRWRSELAVRSVNRMRAIAVRTPRPAEARRVAIADVKECSERALGSD